MKKPFYKVGDTVEIVNYGHLIWENKNFPSIMSKLPTYREEGDLRFVDISSEIVGKRGVVSNIENTQGVPKYSMSGIKEKSSWYREDQMLLINR